MRKSENWPTKKEVIFFSPWPGIILMIIIAGIGWLLTFSHGVEQDRRHFKAKLLTEAFQILYQLACRDIKSLEGNDFDLLTRSMAAINTFGTDEQQKKVFNFFKAFISVKGESNYDIVPLRSLLITPIKKPNFGVKYEDSLLLQLRKDLANLLEIDNLSEDFYLLKPPNCDLVPNSS